MLYKVVLTFESEEEILKCVNIQIKANNNFPVMLFIIYGSFLQGGDSHFLVSLVVLESCKYKLSRSNFWCSLSRYQAFKLLK